MMMYTISQEVFEPAPLNSEIVELFTMPRSFDKIFWENTLWSTTAFSSNPSSLRSVFSTTTELSSTSFTELMSTTEFSSTSELSSN